MKTNGLTKTIGEIIEKTVARFYQKDQLLINDKAHEQTISARIMCYLQDALPDWDVEFNRQAVDRRPKTDEEGTKRRPDIIIHKRGPKGSNLAVILVKCEWNRGSREKDENVAESIKRKHQYQPTFLLEVRKKSFQL
jgi:hypothetical protein